MTVRKLLKLSILVGICAILLTGCGGKKEEKVKSEREMYESAFQALDRGNFETAIERYTELETVYPYGTYTTQGQLEIAYAYYKTNERERALAEVDNFLELHPNHAHLDYAYYLRGLINLPIKAPKLGERLFKDQEAFSDHAAKSSQEAFESFREIVERFPFSEYAEASRQKMVNLVNVFARNDVRIAKFYMHKKAYVGAINRCKSVLDNYPNSPHAEEALAILSYSYRQLNLTELADDTRRVLAYNFPQSRFLQTDDAVIDTELIERTEQTFVFGLFR